MRVGIHLSNLSEFLGPLQSLLEQRLLNKEYRELVSDELSAAFNDPDCSLVWLVNNEYYVVEELDDERSAKKLIQYLIGDLVRRVGAKQG